LHAEDVGWPPKKTGENINAKVESFDFVAAKEESEAVLCAA